MIFGFGSGQDVLDFRTLDADAATPGNQAFAFGGEVGQGNTVWAVDLGGDIVVRGDTSGDGIADFEVRLADLGAVAPGDIWL